MQTKVAEKKPEEQNSPSGPSTANDLADGAVQTDGANPAVFDARAILGLQAFAGNAAVASLMASRQVEPETGPAGGGEAGAPISESAPPRIPQLHPSDPAQALATAGSLPPAQLLIALGSVGAAASSAASLEHARLATHPPHRPYEPAHGPLQRRDTVPISAHAATAEPTTVPQAPPGDEAGAAHLHARRAELESGIQGAHQAGLRESAQPLGEDEIHPTAPPGVLRAAVSPNGAKPPPPEVGETDHAVSLIAQQEKGPEIQAALAQGLAQMTAEKQLHQARSASEQARAGQEMQQLEETSATEQAAERSAARGEVAAMRTRWTGEQRTIAAESGLESDKTVGSALETIAHQQAEAKQQAEAHRQEGQREAEAAKRQGDHEAAAEREKATGKSPGGFLGWAAAAAQSLVEHAKQAVHSVLEKARALVSAAIDRAKQLATAVVEKARQVIAGVVRAGTDTLKAIGARASSAFRAVSDRFRQTILERIAIAGAAVNRMAAFLKEKVQRALNGLGTVMVASVGLLESGLQAAVHGVRAAVQGAIQFARNAVEALGTFAELVRDVAANPIQWVSNLAASAMDGVRNHLWPVLKESIQEWFDDKVEAVLGLGAAVWGLLQRGGITAAQVARVAWEGIKSMIPPTIISVLIEKVVSLLVPAAAAALLIVQAIQAAWASLGRIVQAFDAFIKYLKAVKLGDAGQLFGQALAAGAVALIDFLSNFLLQRLMGAAGKVAGPLKALAKRIGLRLSGVAKGAAAGASKAGAFIKGAAGGAREWAGLEGADLAASVRRASRRFKQSKVGSAVTSPYDAWRGARVGKQLAARGGIAPVHMTIREFARNEGAQRELFAAAQKVRESQEAFAKSLLADLKIHGEATSILKRPDFEGFRRGILEKAARKGYTHVGQMDDMVRGRINLPNARDVEAVAEALETQTKTRVVSTIGPRLEAGVPAGYPRYHVVLVDAETGITHEWQVGTTAVTRAYQAEGIAIPEALKPFPKGMRTDLHDIQYDIFNSIEREYPRVAEKFGIPAFRAKVALLASEAGKRGDEMLTPAASLPERLSALHADAAEILRRLVEAKGPDFVRQFYH